MLNIYLGRFGLSMLAPFEAMMKYEITAEAVNSYRGIVTLAWWTAKDDIPTYLPAQYLPLPLLQRASDGFDV